jgi:hypothetical protein
MDCYRTYESAYRPGRHKKYLGRYDSRQRAYWQRNPERNRAKASRALKKASANLTDSYVRRKLRDLGVPPEARTAALISDKRQALIARRLAAELRAAASPKRGTK